MPKHTNRSKTGSRGATGSGGQPGPRGPTGGLSGKHIDSIGKLREQLQEAIREAEPVKALQQRVQGVLEDELAQLHTQLEHVQKEQRIQFERIAQIQAQLDQLLGILMKR